MGYYEFREEMSQVEVSSVNTKIFNVGWIDQEHSFLTGASPIEFVNKLKRIIIRSETNPFKPIVWRCRGQDKCSLCQSWDLVLEEDGEMEVLGSSNLFIPWASVENSFFISPSLIYHNIVEHNYLPPSKYIESVLSVDEGCEYLGDAIYMIALGLEDFLEYID